jgi:hypothetical protein
MLRVDEKTLHREMRGSAATPQRPPAGFERHGRLSSAPGLTFGLERYVLSVLVQHPELLTSINEVLDGLGVGLLDGEDFAQVEERALFERVAGHVAEGDGFDLEELFQGTESPLREQLDSLLGLAEGAVSPSEEQTELAVVMCALRLKELRLRRQSEELRYLLEDARAQEDMGAVRRWGRMVDELAIQLASLQREKAARDSLGYVRSELLHS